MSAMNEPGFNRNYRVPKRKSNEMSTGTTGRNNYNNYNTPQSSILGNSYYNSYYENPSSFGSWNQGYSQYSQQSEYSQQSQQQPNTLNSPVEPITQNIYNALSHIKEKPKNFRKDIFKETVPDVEDSSLPKELTAMFQPLFCKLCVAQLSSNVMAKLHYKSRNHEKKIKKFLVEYSQRTGEPLHKRAKLMGIPKVEEDKNPKWFHCEVCDLPLTGKLHAESHYMGKNHQKVLMGHKAPAGRGNYNDEGKWIRNTTKKIVLAPGEDTFGMDFKSQEQQTNIAAAVAAAAIPNNQQQSKFQCEICNISATCQEQLEMHFKGQKHQKRMKQKGLQPHFTALPTVKATVVETPQPSKSVDINLAVYRTPSGDFYCSTCNLALNSEVQFKIHLKSKGHMKKSSQPKSQQ